MFEWTVGISIYDIIYDSTLVYSDESLFFGEKFFVKQIILLYGCEVWNTTEWTDGAGHSND